MKESNIKRSGPDQRRSMPLQNHIMQIKKSNYDLAKGSKSQIMDNFSPSANLRQPSAFI